MRAHRVTLFRQCDESMHDARQRSVYAAHIDAGGWASYTSQWKKMAKVEHLEARHPIHGTHRNRSGVRCWRLWVRKWRAPIVRKTYEPGRSLEARCLGECMSGTRRFNSRKDRLRDPAVITTRGSSLRRVIRLGKHVG